jgi:hypothetical protein
LALEALNAFICCSLNSSSMYYLARIVLNEGSGSSSFSLTPLTSLLVWYATRSAKHLAPVWTQACICRVKQHTELCQPTGNPDFLVVVMLITVYVISVLAVLETSCRLTRRCREGIPSTSGVYDTHMYTPVLLDCLKLTSSEYLPEPDLLNDVLHVQFRWSLQLPWIKTFHIPCSSLYANHPTIRRYNVTYW